MGNRFCEADDIFVAPREASAERGVRVHSMTGACETCGMMPPSSTVPVNLCRRFQHLAMWATNISPSSTVQPPDYLSRSDKLNLAYRTWFWRDGTRGIIRGQVDGLRRRSHRCLNAAMPSKMSCPEHRSSGSACRRRRVIHAVKS